jgi:hypothetical protein
VYVPGNGKDLQNQWEALKRDPYDQYSLSIQNYIQKFSKRNVLEAISQSLSAASKGITDLLLK